MDFESANFFGDPTVPPKQVTRNSVEELTAKITRIKKVMQEQITLAQAA